MPHTAVILIALGGPRSPDEVGPFMTAFMGRPAPPAVISAVIERYKMIGGRSPLPKIVKAQAEALEVELGAGFRAYEGFRYSSPSIPEAFEKAVKDGAGRVVGLSMSPFETGVTTGEYRRAFEQVGDQKIKKTFIPSWHDNPLFIKAWQEKVSFGLRRFRESKRNYTEVIFTSHSVPVRCITSGDPYQRQIEEAVRLVAEGVGLKHWRVAWQSKAARATEPWLEPEVETIIDDAASKGFEAVFEVPIGFTCDHMETLYDIDVVHSRHAKGRGLLFERAESLNTMPTFIKALAAVVKEAIE